MPRLKNQRTASMTHLFIYALTFLVLWEWLRPIPVITYTADIHVFVWFAFISAALIYLRVPYWVIIPVLLVVSLYGIHIIFHEGSFLSREGGLETLRLFSSEVWHNTGLIFSGDFSLLTDPFRTFLLFMLLALICYLLYFWIFQTRRIFFFLLTTVIYVTVLDTFTAVDASAAIVRIVIIGFFMLTLLHMLKVQEEERAIGRRAAMFFSPAWMYTLIFMIMVATTVGMAAPKPDPQWDDPVPAMRGFVLGEENGSGTGLGRVGYGDNDERLGGGFMQDEGTVFTAEVEEASYWRGESKHEYTGHGWVAEPDHTASDDIIDYLMYERLTETEERETSIEMEEGVGFSHFFHPGQLNHVDPDTLSYSVDGDEEASGSLTYLTDTVGGRVEAESQDGEEVVLSGYDLVYAEPTFPIETLENASEDDPEGIQELYLQLPDDLPDRVAELAEEITEEEDNRYDMAVAVEQYFSESGFTYQTQDVPVPEDDEDYVDQFLFESQVGYCDNYSTAMAVLLRTLDIPTRWVKGFTAGEQIEVLDDDRYLYEISNGNAHSWVEVYFPEVGWVPFEPTQGFENYAEFEEDDSGTDFDIDGPDGDDTETPEGDMNELLPEMEEGADDMEEGAAGTGSGRGWNMADLLSNMLTPRAIMISILTLIMVMVVYQKQNQLQNKYFLFHYKILGRNERFSTAYRRLLWILENEGLPQSDGETLREYARRVDHALSSQAMMKLTKVYEQVYYGRGDSEGDWQKLKKDWEEIVKSLSY